VRAFACRSLDWCVIQLAAQQVRRSAGPSSKGWTGLDRVVRGKDLFDGSIRSPIDLVLGEDGSFSYPSAAASPFEANNTVFGRLFRVGEDWTRHPTAILLHGWNASWCYRHTQPRLAHRLARSNINVAMIELPYHMQRRPRIPPGLDFISSDLGVTLGAARQALADTSVLVDWLLEQGCPRVGLWGFSLGAWLAGLLARFDPRLHFVVLTTPIVRIDRVIEELPFCEPIRHGLRQGAIDLSWLNLSAQPPCIATSKILIMESRYDLFAPPETLEELGRTWQGSELWRLPHGHISVMGSTATLGRASDWLVRKAQSLTP
jgi:hypothetical protein